MCRIRDARATNVGTGELRTVWLKTPSGEDADARSREAATRGTAGTWGRGTKLGAGLDPGISETRGSCGSLFNEAKASILEWLMEIRAWQEVQNCFCAEFAMLYSFSSEHNFPFCSPYTWRHKKSLGKLSTPNLSLSEELLWRHEQAIDYSQAFENTAIK